MRLFRKRGTRSGVVLFSVAALALAMTGILYAHWTDTLEAHAEINTGYLGVEWSPTGTDDDGFLNNDGSGSDDAAPDPVDWWGIASSVDPADHGPGPVARYDKDVGACFSFLEDTTDDGFYDTLRIEAHNTYPSYYCTVYTDVSNNGTVPVKAGAFGLEVMKNGGEVPWTILGDGLVGVENDLWDEMDLDFQYQLILDISQGIYCGTQIDPEENVDVSAWFHVEQGAMENSNYEFWMDQEFVNWNEWDASFCTIGAIVADPDGNPIGIANGTDMPDPLPMP